MSKRLADKVALVTGGGTGIGREACLVFAEQGASIVVAGIPESACRATAEEIERAGGRAIAIATDVTSAAEVDRAVDTAVERFGSLDIIFNNAGSAHDTDIEATTDAIWDSVLDVTLKGVFLGCRAAVRVMRPRGRGVIINSGSTAAFVGFAKRSAYCAAKGGVIAMTRAIAIETAKLGIRANCIVPGATDTDMVRDIYALQVDPGAAQRMHAERQPMGRLSTVRDIANAILFLATDESSTMTGSCLVVDSGYSAA